MEANKQTTEGTLNAISLFLGFLNPPKWLSDSSGWMPPVSKVADELLAAMPFFEGNADVLAVLKQLELDLGALMLKLAINTPEIRKRVVSVEVPAFVKDYQRQIIQLIADAKRPPLGDMAQKILTLLRGLDETEALTSEQIVDSLCDEYPDTIGNKPPDASTVRKRHLPQLEPYGLTKTPHGYCIR